MPFFRAARTTARTAAFMPGASPPLVNTPIVLIINVFSIPPHGKILKRLHSTFAAYAFTIPFLFYYTDISEVVKWYSKKLTSPIQLYSVFPLLPNLLQLRRRQKSHLLRRNHGTECGIGFRIHRHRLSAAGREHLLPVCQVKADRHVSRMLSDHCQQLL